MGPSDLGESCRRDICLTLEDMGFEIEASHHEVAIAQHEIDFKYSEALSAADNILTFKMVVKSAADSHGLCATFMPKPVYGQCGSGMHTNMSSLKMARMLFMTRIPSPARAKLLISLLQASVSMSRASVRLPIHLVNSTYKRLVPGYEAPCYIAWTTCNRSALIRVPDTRGVGTRVELRSPDPACNPYRSFLCCFAGLEGIREGMTPPPPVSANIYDMKETEREKQGLKICRQI